MLMLTENLPEKSVSAGLHEENVFLPPKAVTYAANLQCFFRKDGAALHQIPGSAPGKSGIMLF